MDEPQQATLDMIEGLELERVTMGEVEKLLQDALEGDEKAIRQLKAIALRTHEQDLKLLEALQQLKDLYQSLGDTEEERHRKLEEILEKENGNITDVLPTAPYYHVFKDFLTYHGKQRFISTTSGGRRKTNRNKEIDYAKTENGYNLTSTDTRTGDIITIAAENLGKLNGKAAKKCFTYLLVQANKQNFKPEISFHLQDLVDNEMYSSLSNARRGITNAMRDLMSIKFGGTVGKRHQEMGVLFYHMTIDNNYVTVSVNEKMDIEGFVAKYYAPIPKFFWALQNTQAVDLCEYACILVRGNHKDVVERGYLNISLRTIRDKLGLPTKESYEAEGKEWNRREKQLVQNPIIDAVEEIKKTATERGYTDLEFEIMHLAPEPKGDAWLDGFVRVWVKGEMLEYCKMLNQKQVEKIESAATRAAKKKTKK